MGTTSNPRISISIAAAQQAAAVKGRNELICDTVPSTVAAVSGKVYKDVLGYNVSKLDLLFGSDTNVRHKIEQFRSGSAAFPPLNVCVQTEDAANTARVNLITITGAEATSDGVITISAVDAYQWKKDITVITGETMTQVAVKIAAAINAMVNIPVTASAALGVVSITAKEKGASANQYNYVVDGLVGGLTFAVTEDTAGVSTDDVSAFFLNFPNTRYTGILWPIEWDINPVKNFLDARFNAPYEIKDGVAFIGGNLIFDDAITEVASLNSPSLCFGGARIEVNQPASWTMSYFMGVRAKRLTQDAPITDNISTLDGPQDNFGGSGLASLPYFNTPLRIAPVADPDEMYSIAEQVELEEAGFSTYGVNEAENGMITGAMVTTYSTDNLGLPNNSFHFLNYVDTASQGREIMFYALKAKYGQTRLTEGAITPGLSMANASGIRASVMAIYKGLASIGIAQAGAVAETFFDANLTVTLDIANRKVNIAYKLPIVTQLAEMFVASQLSFVTE